MVDVEKIAKRMGATMRGRIEAKSGYFAAMQLSANVSTNIFYPAVLSSKIQKLNASDFVKEEVLKLALLLNENYLKINNIIEVVDGLAFSVRGSLKNRFVFVVVKNKSNHALFVENKEKKSLKPLDENIHNHIFDFLVLSDG